MIIIMIIAPGGTVVECRTEDPKVPGSNTDQDKK